MALLSTLNSSFAYNAITIGQSCDDKWLPEKFGEKNSKGSRKWILTFMYVIGIIPIIFGLSITVITNMIQLITSALALLYTYAYIRMPKKYKSVWKKSFIHIPDGLYYVICALSLFIYIVTIWKSCLSMSPMLAFGNVAVIIILALLGLWRAKTGDITIHTSVWTGEESNSARPEQS